MDWDKFYSDVMGPPASAVPATGVNRGVSLNTSPAMTSAERLQFNQDYGLDAGNYGRGLPATGTPQVTGVIKKDPNATANWMDTAAGAGVMSGIYPAWVSRAKGDYFSGRGAPRPGLGTAVPNAPGFDPWAGMRMGPRGNGVPGVSLGHVAMGGSGGGQTFRGTNGYTYQSTSDGGYTNQGYSAEELAKRIAQGKAIGDANRASANPTYSASGENNAFMPTSYQNSVRQQTGY